MSEIDFLAVSAILMIISDFYWYWLLRFVSKLPFNFRIFSLKQQKTLMSYTKHHNPQPSFAYGNDRNQEKFLSCRNSTFQEDWTWVQDSWMLLAFSNASVFPDHTRTGRYVFKFSLWPKYMYELSVETSRRFPLFTCKYSRYKLPYLKIWVHFNQNEWGGILISSWMALRLSDPLWQNFYL